MKKTEGEIPIFDIPSNIVYVREVPEDEVPEQAANGRKIYAIHDSVNGERLAMTDDRKLAFRLARNHERTPVSVH